VATAIHLILVLFRFPFFLAGNVWQAIRSAFLNGMNAYSNLSDYLNDTSKIMKAVEEWAKR
jgi:hypothetical protein